LRGTTKKIDLGQTIQILANLGVIAGIVFLGIELQQNNALLSAQARAGRTELAKDGANRFLANPELVSIMVRRRNNEPLTDEDAQKVNPIMRALLVNMQHIYTEYREGLIPVEDVPIELWRTHYRTNFPDLPKCWADIKPNYRSTFVKFFDESIVAD